MKKPFHIIIMTFLLLTAAHASAVGQTTDSITQRAVAEVDTAAYQADTVIFSEMTVDEIRLGCQEHGEKLTLYDYPYSRTRSMPDWKKLWLNTGILMTAGVSTMLILEALPADATAWNKTENAKIPPFKRWWRNVHDGPVWDGDNLVFNYILHPYAGAAYYMGARSNGFNMWGSFLYTFCISSFFWEYGFEAFNEIPSIQDLLITPVVGTI